MKKTIPVAILVIALILGGFYLLSKESLNKPGNMAGQEKTKTSTSVTNKLILKAVTDTNLGEILVAENGMTLYKFTKDTAGVSNCSGQCAINWPPYTVSDPVNLQSDPAIKGMVSTIKREDGTMQITYNGEPLYFWINDMKVGDTTGQNVGGVWFVVKP